MELFTDHLINIICSFAENIVITFFFVNTLTLRFSKWKYYFLYSAFVIAMMYPLIHFLPNHHLIVMIIGAFMQLSGILIFTKDKLIKQITMLVIPYALNMLSSFMFLAFAALCMPEYTIVLGRPNLFAEVFILSIMFVLEVITVLVIKRSSITRSSNTMLYTALMIGIQLIMWTYMIFQYYVETTFLHFFTAILIYSVFTAVLTTLIIRSSAEAGKEIMRKKAIEQQYNQLSNQYYQLRDNYISYKKLRHDLKDHINVLNGLAMQGETTLMREYASDLLDSWDALSDSTFCDIPAVDVVLASKYNLAQDSNIRTDFRIGSISSCGIDAIYISTVIANLLNNAISAAQSCVGNAFIELECMIKSGYLVITCRNSCNPNEERKERSDDHGYGIQIITEVASLHGGNYKYEKKENEFVSVFNIPIGKV